MNTTNERGRGDVEDLLPWHAAGTLSRQEAQRVEAALANDRDLAPRYELVREELVQTIELNESLGAPSARAMQALFAKIDAEPARRPAAAAAFGARLRGFFAGRSPRMLAWSASAAALVIVLQAGLIGAILLNGNGPDNGAGRYHTASVPQAFTGAGDYALIAFKSRASAADITGFLWTNKLSIAAGPIGGGLYRVRIAPTNLPKAKLEGIVKALQGDKVVGFIALMPQQPAAGRHGQQRH